MKRFAIVAAVATLSLVGCKKKEENKVEPMPAAEPAPVEAAKPADAPAVPADPAAVPADPAAAAVPAAGAEDMNVGIAECDDLVKRVNACEKLDAAAKTSLNDRAKAWKASAATGDEKVKTSTTDECKKAATDTDAALKTAGC